MKKLSAFDILGPIMVGPSSSHTAGALRISALVNRIANSEIIDVKFTLFGSFATTYKGHGTDRALLGGILGFATDDVRIRNSLDIAKTKGIHFEFIVDAITKHDHPNTILVNAKTKKGQTISVLGQSTGGGSIRIIKINGVSVKFTGEYHTILIEQEDERGVIANITAVLNEQEINIAFMRVFRNEKGGTAYTIIETDQNICDGTSEKLLNCNSVRDVSIISI